MAIHVLAALVLGPLVVAVLLPNHPGTRPPDEDAGVFLYTAALIQRGGMPYRDVWDHKPPAIYYLDALGLYLGAGSPVGVWALQVLALGLAALFGYLALARVFGPVAALVGSVAWLVSVPRLFLADRFFTNFTELFALPLQFAALYLFLLEEERPRPTWRSLLLGAAGALTLLLKPTLLAVWVGIALYLALSRAAARRWADLAARLGAAAAGAAPPLAFVVAYFASRGALDGLVDQVVRYNAVYATASATLQNRLEALLAGLWLTATSGLSPLSLVVSFVGLALVARRRAHPLLAVALLALPIAMLLSLSSGRAYRMYYLAWLPPMAVLAALAALLVAGRLAPAAARAFRAPPRATAAVLLAALALAMSARPATLITRVAATPPDAVTREAVDYVLAATRPGDKVLVWGSWTAVNFLSGREAPTRFVYQYAPLYTRGYATREQIDELLAALERQPPVLILDARGSPVTPPLDAAARQGWDPHDALYRLPPEVERVFAHVAARYAHVATLERSGWWVYRYRDAR